MRLLKAERKPLVPSVWQLSLRWEWEGEVGGYNGAWVGMMGYRWAGIGGHGSIRCFLDEVKSRNQHLCGLNEGEV